MSNKNEELASYLIVLIKAMFLVICVFCIEKWQKVIPIFQFLCIMGTVQLTSRIVSFIYITLKLQQRNFNIQVIFCALSFFTFLIAA